MSLDKLGGGSTIVQGPISDERVFDAVGHQLLRSILIELRMMNVKLSCISGLEMQEDDLEE